jgi:hypothetical protein
VALRHNEISNTLTTAPKTFGPMFARKPDGGLIQRYGSFAGSKNLVGGARSLREPVWVAKFPAIREKNRDFVKISFFSDN